MVRWVNHEWHWAQVGERINEIFSFCWRIQKQGGIFTNIYFHFILLSICHIDFVSTHNNSVRMFCFFSILCVNGIPYMSVFHRCFFSIKWFTHFTQETNIHLFLYIYKQSIFDPRTKNCLSFSKKLPPKIV